jgi:hypothetical protein
MGRRRMLAIGLVGTGIYAGAFGAGAGAQSPVPTITPEPLPDPAAPAPAEESAVDPAPVEVAPPKEAPPTPPSAPPAPEPAEDSEPAESAEPARPEVAEPAAPEAAASAGDGAPADDGAPTGPGPAAEAPAGAAGPATGASGDGARKRRGAKPAARGQEPNLTIRTGSLISAGARRTGARPTRGRAAEPAGSAPARAPALEGPAPFSNPSFTLAGAVGPALDASDFFIDRFRVPPVLLPVYQAAGRRYGIRWEILAAINEIETGYGRNVAVSSAGALGWMQFMPSTWETYGIDGNRDGVEDPYDPVDAIFAAARYLRAAGAAEDLPRAIFAYNHADWYVDSVLMRARLIAALPRDLMGPLSALAGGRFPVRGGASYARAATRGQKGRRVAFRMYARPGAPVVAANNGTIVRIGRTRRLGHVVELRDAHGNTYVYARLARASEGAGKEGGVQRLRRGKRITSGSILGRIRRGGDGRGGRMRFELRPAGRGVPRLGAASIVDGWSLLRPGLHRAGRAPGRSMLSAADASLGRILSMSRAALAARVLADERIELYGCGRADVRAGLIDARVLAGLEYLAASGLHPTVSSLKCGHSVFTASGNVSEHSTGSAVDIAAINGIPVLGNQGSGSITELAVQRLLRLQGAMKPHQIITLMRFEGTDNTFAMADHADHIHVGWRPQPQASPVLGSVRLPTP